MSWRKTRPPNDSTTPRLRVVPPCNHPDRILPVDRTNKKKTMTPDGLAAVTAGSIRGSLHTLLELARRSSEADGCCLYELDDVNRTLVIHATSGLHIPEPELLSLSRGRIDCGDTTVEVYPLRGKDSMCGLLTFSFYQLLPNENRLKQMDRLSDVIETVYRLPHLARSLALRISTLDVELIDIKIQDRVLGLLSDELQTSELMDSVVEHVGRAIRNRPEIEILERLKEDLEDRLEERLLLSRAKELLQRRYRMSEEQAYLWMVNQSRNSGRRFGVIARELMDKRL